MVTVIHGVLVEGTAVVEEETVVQLVLNVENIIQLTIIIIYIMYHAACTPHYQLGLGIQCHVQIFL